MGAGENSAPVEFRVLGSLEVIAGEQAVEVKPAKARALLALLLLDPGRPASADRLIDELWGETPPVSAAVSVRVLISRLREALAAVGAVDAIETRSTGYVLRVEPGQIDAHRFETLLARGRAQLAGGNAQSAAATMRGALDLWRGPALAELSDYPSVAHEAARLEELRLVALEGRIEADLACARHDLVAGELESLVKAHPFRERLSRARMLALYRCGRQADALAAFTELREQLVAELGIEPAPELRDLHQQILEQAPGLSLAPAAADAPRALTGVDLPTGVVTFLLTDVEGSSALWEREPDAMAQALDRLEELVQRAVIGSHGVLVKHRGEGDSTFSVFARATDALRAAVTLREELESAAWPEDIRLRVRMALHTGEARERDADYLGTTVNRAARLRSLAEPGQILVSHATVHVAGDELPPGATLVDLGKRPLRGLQREEQVFELRAAGGPQEDGHRQFARELPHELTARAGVFVGREAEIEHLAGLWEQAQAGALRAALLAGEPGIGKTRLAAELARRAHEEGAVVLFGRCDEDLGVPYQPFAQAIGSYVAGCPTAELATQVGQRAGDLARLVPELGDRLLGSRPTTVGDPVEQRERLFDAIVSLLGTGSQARPLLLILDDLQWAAKPTLLMLRHLLRSRQPMRLLVLGTYRDTELDRTHPLTEVLADLRRDAIDITRLRVRRLDAAAVSTYVTAGAVRELKAHEIELARTLHQGTEGNPFFIGEVLRHLAETGLVVREAHGWVAKRAIAEIGLPEGVRDVITRRLSRLSNEANRALAVASVIGETFSLPVLEQVPDAGDNADRLLDAIEETQRAGLIAETGPASYEFSHALIRQTLYAGLTATRRARLHRRVGEAIEQTTNADMQVEALAHHFAEATLAGQTDKAADYALAAARRALNRLASEEAIAQLSRGLELLELGPGTDHARRADLLLTLAVASRELGDLEQNHRATLAAAEDARTIGSADRVAQAALVYWSTAGTGVRDATVPELTEEALRALGDDHPATRARLLARLAHYRAIAESQGFALGDQAEDALALARQTGDPDALATALSVRTRLLYGTERVADRLPLAHELLRLGLDRRDQRTILTAMGYRIDANVELADRAAYDDDVAELQRRTAEVGTRMAKHLVAVTGSMAALFEGRFGEVQALLDQALAQSGGRADPLSAYAARRSLLCSEQGRLEEAFDHARDWTERTGQHAVGHAWIALLTARSGDHPAARRILHQLTSDNLARVPRDHLWPNTLSALAETCGHLRDTPSAAAIYDHLHPHHGHLPTTGGYMCLGAIDRFLGTLAGTLGRPDEAVSHYKTALEIEERMKAAPLAARTQYWYARALRARDAPNDDEQAMKLLQAAAVTAQHLGMAGLMADVRALLESSRQKVT